MLGRGYKAYVRGACAANSAAWLVRRASMLSRVGVRRARKWHVRKLASVLSLLVQSHLAPAKLPLYMLLPKIIMLRSMKNLLL